MRRVSIIATEAEIWLREKGVTIEQLKEDRFARSLKRFMEGASPDEQHQNMKADINRTVHEYQVRAEFIHKFAFAILTADLIRKIRKYGPLIEIGSGTGYWAYELAKAGVD